MRSGLQLLLIIPLLNASVASAEASSWVPIGPEGGPIQALAIDPEHPDTIYAAGYGNIFQSVGEKIDWHPLSPYGAATIAFAGGGVIYLGGGHSWKSIDGGASWQRLHGLDSHFVDAVAVDPGNPDVVYAAAVDGFFNSLDGGATWNTGGIALGIGLPFQTLAVFPFHTLLVDPQAPGTIYLSDGQVGVYKSTDGGYQWAASNSGLPCPSPDGQELCLSSLAFAPDDPATLYAGTYTDGVFRSMDGGASWTASSDGLDGNGVIALSVDPSNPDTIYVATTNTAPFSPRTPTFGVYRSDDRGATWRAADTGLPNVQVGAFAISPTSTGLVYAATARDYFDATGGEGGVYVTTNGGISWERASHGLHATCISGLIATATTPTTLYAGLFHDASLLAASSDDGSSWAGLQLDANVGYIDRLVADPSDPATIYARSGKGLLKTTDGGKTWASQGDPGGYITDFVVDPLEPHTLYAASEGVSKSTDGGATWLNVQDASGTRGQIRAVAVDPAHAAVFAAYDGAVFRSDDGGSTCKETSLAPPTGIVQLVVIDTTPATLVAASDNGAVHVSRDAGYSWQTTWLAVDGKSVGVVTLAVDPTGSRRVYAAAFVPDGSQVFRSDDAGRTWRPIGDLLPNVVEPFTLVGDPNDPDILYVGDCGDGVLELRQQAQPPTSGSSGGGGCAVGAGAESTSVSGMLMMGLLALLFRRLRRSRHLRAPGAVTPPRRTRR